MLDETTRRARILLVAGATSGRAGVQVASYAISRPLPTWGCNLGGDEAPPRGQLRRRSRSPQSAGSAHRSTTVSERSKTCGRRRSRLRVSDGWGDRGSRSRESCPARDLLSEAHCNVVLASTKASRTTAPRLRAGGVKTTLGSDDPPYFGASIGGEYELCRERFGFDDEDLRGISRTAVEAAFCEQTLKERLMQRV